ncbi:MAG: hypothetical protein Q9219_001337 [cf. Caloplaca sp. 3 TL-2023]
MGSGKKSHISTAKVSAAAAPAASAATQSASKSSILRSSFAPSHFQLTLFASVIQGFDSQHLRIHDTVTGRLRCEHVLATKATISCLDWGYHGEKYWEWHGNASTKKRKRIEQVNGIADDVQDVILAFGTSDSDVHLYSPAAAKVVGLLKDVQTKGIRDFKFVDAGRRPEGWSIGGDGKLADHDRSISLPDPTARILCPFGTFVLCASHKVFLVDAELKSPTTSFIASNNIVHSIQSASKESSKATQPSFFLTAAENDRFINVFNKEIGISVGSLVAENDILALAVAPDYKPSPSPSSDHASTLEFSQSALAAVNRDGILELFESPFKFGKPPAQEESGSLKARIKQRTRKAKALVKVIRPDRPAAVVPLLDVTFQDHELVFVWAEGGVDLHFDRIQWRKHDATEMSLDGVHEITKTKNNTAVGAIVMNGVKDVGKMQVDESQAVITTSGQSENSQLGVGEQPEVIDISSGEGGTEYDEDDNEELPERAVHSSSNERDPSAAALRRSPPENDDVAMEDVEDRVTTREQSAEAGNEEPSFGEMIRANAQANVDVQATLAAPHTNLPAPSTERSLQLPSGMSLGTVLTQSLRTNDVSLLETCLHIRDLAIVRATIERLDSSLASTLMQKLAERFHSRPGRAGSLLVWIQWTIVAHGGNLASQPGAMKTLAALHRVISERARSLPLLLSLKGKLDMLESQMNLRASMQARSKAQIAAGEEDEEAVIYVEGQEEDESQEEADVDDPNGRSLLAIDDAVAGSQDAVSENGTSADGDEEMPTMVTNGAFEDSDGEGSQSSDEGMFDEEAESTDQDSGDEGSVDEVDHEDVDPMESDASSEAEVAPQSKRLATTMTTTLSNGIRSKKG